MGAERRLWDFLLRDKESLKRNIYKKAILRGQLSLLAMSVGIIYIIIDYSNGIYFNFSYYLFLIVTSAFTLLINRSGYFLLANFIFLFLLNGLIYVFASNDTYRTGVYFYFMVCALTSLTLCGYEQLITGLLFCGLSLGLFMLAYIFKIFPVIPHGQVPESYVTVAFVTNFTVSIVTTAVLLFFLLEINFRTEEELITNNELLTKTNKELDRFVYSASHDLRSPLSSMLGLIALAKKSDNPEEIKMCLNLMADRINVQDSFIQDIIDYARNSRVALSLEKIQLRSFVKEIVGQLMYSEGKTDIDFQIQIDEDVVIISDRIRLTSVLSNLIANAIKYHDHSKASRFVRIGFSASGQKIIIQVEDNGQGIHPKFQQKVFDMFFRASEASKGSGLGLFIARETLERMNGKISLQSEVDKGSVFSIILPNVNSVDPANG